MGAMTTLTQETRTERLTISLTPGELNDARLVAALRNTTLSELMRDATMAEVATEAASIRQIPIGRAS